MALTRKIRVRSQLSMATNAQNAERSSQSTDESFSVHTVDPNLLSDWVVTNLQKEGKAHLATITRNSVLLCKNDQPHGPPEIFAVAETVHFPFVHTALYAELRNVTILDPHWLQQHLFLIIPNSHVHKGLEQHAFAESHALFGLLDRCVFPNCTYCRQSSLCLTGHMVFSTATTVTPHNAQLSKWARILTGEILETLPVILTTTTVHLRRPVITSVLDGPSVEVWAVCQITDQNKNILIAYTRK